MQIPESNDTIRACRTALIAEDDEDIAQILEFMLDREGLRALRAADGREAVRLIDGVPPVDVVMLDVMLPYIDGFELIQHIRGKPEWSAVPVVMLTAKSQENDIVRALEAGASDYVVKPFKPQELMARIRRLLQPMAGGGRSA